MTRGRFVVLEGGEACGKTTQTRLLVARLRADGRDVVATFEPGKTRIGSQIRALLLDGRERIVPATEALLLAADRAEHVEEVVRPALERGADVVSDRYVPSSLAYQGVGRGLGVDRVEVVDEVALGRLSALEQWLVEVGQSYAVALIAWGHCVIASLQSPLRNGSLGLRRNRVGTAWTAHESNRRNEGELIWLGAGARTRTGAGTSATGCR